MQKTLVIIGISLAACFAAAAIALHPPGAPPSDNERIEALEIAVREERAARQMLEEQLLLLYAELERLDAREAMTEEARPTQNNAADMPADMPAEVAAEAATANPDRDFRRDRIPVDRRQAMLEAGFTSDRVDWILQREDEVRFEAMQARFAARNAGEALNPFDPALNPEAILRAELGDTDYETYLAANNRPTSAAVSNVLASSPAARAGLQPGDRIVAYDGQRVFDGGDLMQHAMTPGTGNVVVDVLRDGTTLQVVLPRGPIGVEIGRFRRR
jgi:hypothetical protein